MTQKEGETLKPSKMSPEEFKARFTACRPSRKQILDLLDDGSVLVALGKFAIHVSFDDWKKNASTLPEFLGFEGKTYIVSCACHPVYLLYRPSAHDKFEELQEATNVLKIANGGDSDD